jgi:hypothetical protein
MLNSSQIDSFRSTALWLFSPTYYWIWPWLNRLPLRKDFRAALASALDLRLASRLAWLRFGLRAVTAFSDMQV